jgi:hypothetical protein
MRSIGARAGSFTFDGREQRRGIDRFRQVAVHSGREASLPIPDHRVSGHGDDGQMAPVLALAESNGQRGFETTHFRHLDVHEHDVKRLPIELGEHLEAVAGHRHRVTPPG